MKHKHIIHTLALLTAITLPACSDEATSELLPDAPVKEEPVKKLVDVNIRISTNNFSGLTVQQDGGTTRTAPTGYVTNEVTTAQGRPLTLNSKEQISTLGTPTELINDWFMIWESLEGTNAGQIAKIVWRKDAVKEQDVTTQETFTMPSIPVGTYRLYVFGNITKEQFESAVKNHMNVSSYTLSEGPELPTNLKDIVWKDEFKNQLIKDHKLVPLSAFYDNVKITENTSMDIRLERVVGKLQFFFSNRTSSDLRIKSFEMIPIRTKSYFFEHDKQGGTVATPSHTHDNVKETLKPVISGEEGWTVPKHDGYEFTECEDLGYYIHESVPEVSDQYPLGHFKMKLKLERKKNDTWVPEDRTSMLHTISQIERNQWYLQPIMLTDWVLQPEIHYYPPIGGYPVVQVDDNDHFKECYSTFEGVTSDSPFQIRLQIHNLDNPGKLYDITDNTIVKDGVVVGGTARTQPYFISVSDPDKIFKRDKDDIPMLTLNASGIITSPDGQLTGYFSGQKGRAIISVYANIEIATGVQYTYERDLYVIVKQTK